MTAVFRAINALAAGGVAEEVPDYFIAMTTFQASNALVAWGVVEEVPDSLQYFTAVTFQSHQYCMQWQ